MQAATRPPTYVLFVNDAKLFNDDYKLYMERALRESIGCNGTPLRIYLRSRKPTAAILKNQGSAGRQGDVIVGRRPLPQRAPHS